MVGHFVLGTGDRVDDHHAGLLPVVACMARTRSFAAT
jgi:hypothetical protein